MAWNARAHGAGCSTWFGSERQLRQAGWGTLAAWLVLSSVGGAQQPPQLQRVVPPGAVHGQTTRVQVQGSAAADAVIWCSEAQVLWHKTDTENEYEVTIPSSVPPGRVWLRLTDSQGASEVKPFLIGHLPEIREQEPNDRSDQAQFLEGTPIVIQGALQARGDVDHYQVTVRQGQTLVACVDAQRFLESPVDATLQVVSVEGHLLQQNLDHRGLDPQVVWTAPADSQVVVRVFGFPSQPDSTIALGGGDDYQYRLTVTTGPFIEAIVPVASSPQRLSGVRLHGWNLTDEDQLQDLEDVQDEAQSSPLFWPGMVGVFPRPLDTAPVWLATDLSELSSQAPNGSIPRSVAPPMVVHGRIQVTQQVDEFRVQVAQDEIWEIDLHAARLGYPWDPVLEVRSADGTQRLQRVDDSEGRDPKLVWKPPAAGDYRLVVYDLHGHAGPQHWYRLSLSSPEPDFVVTVEPTRWTARVGETVEIPLRIERRHGFAEVLEFQCQLPTEAAGTEALTDSVVRSEAEGESAQQVTLVVTPREPFHGPLRIVARVVDSQPAREQWVPVREGLIDFWLNVQPAPAP